MCTNYKLRECINAHDNDVKSLAILPHSNSFISASRDLSVRLWKEEENKHYKQFHKYNIHKSYISVVHYMKPCLEHPEGVIFSGGYDKEIKGYSVNSAQLQFTLSGHTNTVTSIVSTGKCEILSGSMDCSVLLWDLTTSTIKMTFKGHKHGVWSIMILECLADHFLTGSADKEIYLWNLKSNEIIKKFIGHNDCVRGLLEIPQLHRFLSCSNDNSVRMWCLNTGCGLKEFIGHSSFIYSIARISDDLFVTCGEDSLLCVWNITAFSPVQKIPINAQSIWCVAVCSNKDIVCGSSDGMIRLFSEDPSLQNGVELTPKLSKDVIEDSMIAELPSVGIELLSFPGNYDGQLLKIHDDGCDILYEWSSAQDIWTKKKVLGNSFAEPLKTHDYVFSIDIKDGEPPLKLHYNLNQDPWVVAQKFLDDNDVSPMFLDQVANFIISNSTKQTVDTPSAIYSDPFTGSSRYVPASSQQSTDSQHQFPHKSYCRNDQINIPGLLKKLQEICDNQLPNNIKNTIEHIQNLSSTQADVLCNWVLEKLPTWPNDQLFPFIDILRILVRMPSCNSICFSSNELLVKLISRTIGSHNEACSKGNTLTVVKLMVNAFLQLPGEFLMSSMSKQISEDLYTVAKTNVDKNILIAVASWLLNSSISINLKQEEYRRSEILELCFNFLEIFELKSCAEAVHRTLVTIGTLVCNSDSFSFRETLTMDACKKVNNFSKTFQEAAKWGDDVNKCSRQLESLISSLDFVNF